MEGVAAALGLWSKGSYLTGLAELRSQPPTQGNLQQGESFTKTTHRVGSVGRNLTEAQAVHAACREGGRGGMVATHPAQLQAQEHLPLSMSWPLFIS